MGKNKTSQFPIHENDDGRLQETWMLFANLDRTPQPGLPGNLDINKLWIIFQIVYGHYTITNGKRTGFNKLEDALGSSDGNRLGTKLGNELGAVVG